MTSHLSFTRASFHSPTESRQSNQGHACGSRYAAPQFCTWQKTASKYLNDNATPAATLSFQMPLAYISNGVGATHRWRKASLKVFGKCEDDPNTEIHFRVHSLMRLNGRRERSSRGHFLFHWNWPRLPKYENSPSAAADSPPDQRWRPFEARFLIVFSFLWLGSNTNTPTHTHSIGQTRRLTG